MPNSIDEIYAYLLTFAHHSWVAADSKLSMMHELSTKLGSPQNSYKIIHIAGSKGKGSTATLLAAILARHERRVGLYTSPHILHWQERISMVGDHIPERIFLEAFAELFPHIAGKGPQDFAAARLPLFFELTTLLGFLVFKKMQAEFVVLETGIGGLLDSTNIVNPILSIITPIELEHTAILGRSLKEIAYQKAGIIKKQIPCLSAKQKIPALSILKKTAREKQVTLGQVNKIVQLRTILLGLDGTKATLQFRQKLSSIFTKSYTLHIQTKLIGKQHAENAALASIAAIHILGESASPEKIQGALCNTSLDCRFQILSEKPLVILDGAHTANSVTHTLASLRALDKQKGILLFACAIDKNHAAMAKILARHFRKIIITRPGDFKQSDSSSVFASFSHLCRSVELTQEDDFHRAIKEAYTAAQEQNCPLLITGSFYLCAIAYEMLNTQITHV